MKSRRSSPQTTTGSRYEETGVDMKAKKRWDRATPSARSAWRTAPLLTLALATPLCAQTAPPPIYSTVITTAPDPLLNNLSIPATATTQGMWSSTQQWPLVPLHVTVMPDGRVLSYGTPADGESVQDCSTLDIWDPALALTCACH